MFLDVHKRKNAKAILIGCNYTRYPDSKLSGCVNDALTVRKFLIDQYCYKHENVVLLHDNMEDYDIFADYPTRDNIIRELYNAANQSKSGKIDTIWIHYSGHGSYVRDSDHDEDDGLDECILPCDFKENGIITDDTLFNILKEITCPVYITMDCCHSGTGFDLPFSYVPVLSDASSNNNNDHTEYNEFVENTGQGYDIKKQQYHEVNIPICWNRRLNYEKVTNNDKYIENKEIYMFSGCRDFQTSADITMSNNNTENSSFGAFTDALVTSLEYHRLNTTYINLYKTLLYILQERGYTQRTLFSTSNDKFEI